MIDDLTNFLLKKKKNLVSFQIRNFEFLSQGLFYGGKGVGWKLPTISIASFCMGEHIIQRFHGF